MSTWEDFGIMASQSADEQFVPLENDKEGAFKKATLYSETDTNPSMRCGMFCFSPSWLQVFSNMRSFSMYYGVCSLVTSALTAYLTSQVTTLEKQYGLSSSETGLLLSMNDIGFLVFVLIISLFSRYSNKPKILGIGVLIFGLSAILSALPHFAVPGLLVKDVSATNSSQERQLVPKSSQRLGDVTLCSDNNELLHGESSWNISADSERTCSSKNVENQSTSKFLVIFLISVGLFLQGMAKAPRLPVTYSFIDDNVVRTKTGLFAGVIGFLAIFGPTIAFIVGARMSRIYVTLEDVPFSRSDPRWVGAWWLGFVIFGSAAILLSGPLFMFPRKMRINSRNSDRQRLARQQQQSVDKKMAALQQIKVCRDTQQLAQEVRLQCPPFAQHIFNTFGDIPGAFRRLLTNYNFMSILIAGSLDMMAMAGGLAFAPKYLEVFFGLSIYKANMLQGITTFIAGAVGMLTGGFLVSKLKLSLAGCLKLIVVVRLISSLSSGVALLLNCPEVEVVRMSHLRDIYPSCAGCICPESDYFPVCGSNGKSYFSPCMAGCTAIEESLFTNCSCGSVVPGTDQKQVPQNTESEEFTAVPGLCDAECGLLTVFIVTQTLSSFAVSISSMPQIVASIRSVGDADKTLCIGVMSFLYSVIGWMLGPMVFGRLVDGACVLWNMNCSKRGSCALYDKYTLRDHQQGTKVGGRALSVAIFALCLARLTFFTKEHPKGVNGKTAERRREELIDTGLLWGNQ